MEDLRATVQRITNDLNALMRELSGKDDTQARELVGQMLTSEALADFKSSVDAMRHLMWIYIEACSHHAGTPTIVQSTRLQKAVEMLRVLHGTEVPPQFTGPETFFEHVQSVVDSYGKPKKHNAA